MLAVMHIVAMAPFLMHVFTAVGTLTIYEQKIDTTDVPDSWMLTLHELYQLGFSQGSFRELLAYIQLILSCVAMVTHFLGHSGARKISYAILTGLYAVTQLRHLLTSTGPRTIGYLYIHIAVFGILVLYQDMLMYRNSDMLTYRNSKKTK